MEQHQRILGYSKDIIGSWWWFFSENADSLSSNLVFIFDFMCSIYRYFGSVVMNCKKKKNTKFYHNIHITDKCLCYIFIIKSRQQNDKMLDTGASNLFYDPKLITLLMLIPFIKDSVTSIR